MSNLSHLPYVYMSINLSVNLNALRISTSVNVLLELIVIYLTVLLLTIMESQALCFMICIWSCNAVPEPFTHALHVTTWKCLPHSFAWRPHRLLFRKRLGAPQPFPDLQKRFLDLRTDFERALAASLRHEVWGRGSSSLGPSSSTLLVWAGV